MGEKNRPDDHLEPVFPGAFELDEPERVFINPNATRGDIEAILPIIRVVTSKEMGDLGRQAQEDDKDKEENQ